MKHVSPLIAAALAGCTTIPSQSDDPNAIEGTYWTVTAIDGKDTGSGENYFIGFENGRLSARFGCNRISGPYSRNGDHLSAGPLIATRMGCPEPAMTFETRGNAVLSSNARIERIDPQHARLVSEAGTIDLGLRTVVRPHQVRNQGN